MDDLKVIALKLDQLNDTQERCNEKVTDIRARLYDPDEGLFARVSSLQSLATEHEQLDIKREKDLWEWTEEHEERDQDLRTNVASIVDTMQPLTDDYKIRQSHKKWTDKITWAVLAAIISILVPLVWHTMAKVDVAQQPPAQVQKK